MKLIDRYIYIATRHLNEKERIELEEEIRETINDMLPDDYTDEDVSKVLYKLGNPTLLAEKYQEKPKYLIGPYLYNNYIYVLKLVLAIILCIAPITAFITVVSEMTPTNDIDFLVKLVTNILSHMFQGAFQVFIWVTIIFACMERVKSPYMIWPFTGKEWTINDLVDAPLTRKNKIEKSDPVFSIVFILIFTVAIIFYDKYLGWYTFENGVWKVIPLFYGRDFYGYLPLFLLLALLGIITAILKLIYQRWTKGLAIINTIYNLVSIVVSSSFLLNRKVFNPKFMEELAKAVNTDLNQVLEIWRGGTIGIVVFIIVGAGIWEIIQGFRKINPYYDDFKALYEGKKLSK